MTSGSLPAAGLLRRAIEEAARDGGPFSASSSTRLDRAEEFPAAAMAVLDAFGLHRWFVPAQWGGRLDLPILVQLLRVVARYDLTVAIAYGKTFLGSAPVWVAGDPGQARHLAGHLAQAGLVTWALTERGHGSDLLSGELTATRTAAGWQLDGEKWLINNATRAPLVCLLARTADAGGPRGFSLFLVDKSALATGSYRCLRRELLHGIRGADISGLVFDGAEAPPGALIGREGAGIEIVLTTMQWTRTACVALSLGAADRALALAASHVTRSHRYGGPLEALPAVRAELGVLAADLLVMEAVSHLAARFAHLLPEEMSIAAAVVKSFVPALADALLDRAGGLLGAQSVLLEEPADGIFQKLQRDHRIVAIFDGSTVVNRNVLINQFPHLARAFRTGRHNLSAVAEAARLGAPSGHLIPGRLGLISRSGCSLVQSVPEAAAQVRDRIGRGQAPPELGRLVTGFTGAVEAVLTEIAGCGPWGRDVPASAFLLAQRYELCFAGAACLWMWLANEATHGPQDALWQGAPCQDAPCQDALWQGALWLRAALARVLTMLCPGDRRSLADLDASALRLAGIVVAIPPGAPSFGLITEQVPRPATEPAPGVAERFAGSPG